MSQLQTANDDLGLITLTISLRPLCGLSVQEIDSH